MAVRGLWDGSNVTQKELKQFKAAKLLLLGSWRVPGCETQPNPQPDEFVVFASFLERGLGFPSSQYFRRFLHFYNI
jgi:hypothetical protein